MSARSEINASSVAARRDLSKRLSALLASDALSALAHLPDCTGAAHSHSHRIGISGPPGSGKSSLLAAWAQLVLRAGGRIGVLAIDPGSPVSGGSLLGDRIRMDAVTGEPGFFLRSVSSRAAHDGLCPNAGLMLEALDSAGFDHVVLETVGVGQAEYAARALVDTFVVVVNPESGDIVQSMKAGILEVADVIVVNKADLHSAQRTARDLAAILALRSPASRRPALVRASTKSGEGLQELHAALTAHALTSSADRAAALLQRRKYIIGNAVAMQFTALLAGDSGTDPARIMLQRAVARLGQAIDQMKS